MTAYHLNLQGDESELVDFVLGPYPSLVAVTAAMTRVAQRLAAVGVEVGGVGSGAHVEMWPSVADATEDDAVEWFTELMGDE
jgi:hypothetical protein